MDEVLQGFGISRANGHLQESTPQHLISILCGCPDGMGAACPHVPITPELPHVVLSPGGAESFFSKHAQGHLGIALGFAQGRSQPGPSRSAEGHLSDQRCTQREDAQRCPLAGGR